MQQSHNGGRTGLKAANLAEAVGHVEQDQHAGRNQRDDALEQELLTDGGIDVADLILDEVVVGVLLIQGSSRLSSCSVVSVSLPGRVTVKV